MARLPRQHRAAVRSERPRTRACLRVQHERGGGAGYAGGIVSHGHRRPAGDRLRRGGCLMARLRDLARLIRSKNAGPFELTFDIMFVDPSVYERVKRSGAIDAQVFARLFGVPEGSVRVYAYDPAFSYKITIPRPSVSGSVWVMATCTAPSSSARWSTSTYRSRSLPPARAGSPEHPALMLGCRQLLTVHRMRRDAVESVTRRRRHMTKGVGHVIVVGAGNAALVAALAAHEQGAKVTVLEAGTREERGGNSRFAGATFRFAHDGMDSIAPLIADESKDLLPVSTTKPYPQADFARDLMETSGRRADRALTQVLVEESYDTVRWMRDKNVKWELATRKFIDASKLSEQEPYVLPPGGAVRVLHEGIGLMDDLFAAVEATDIEVWYDSPAHSLIADGSTVTGVRVRRPHEFVDLSGSVILACGGFESNPEMRLRYLGSGWELVKVRGTRFNRGTMLEEALRAGAQSTGHWGGCHATPVAWDAPDVGDLALTDSTGRHSYPYGILVNRDGRRFLDEGERYYLHTYAKTGSAIRAQPQAWAAQIFDQKTLECLQPRYSTQQPVVADTVRELAVGLGIAPDALERTIDAFNAAVPEDSGGFDPLVEDGLAATGIDPPKRNWALALDAPPFVAYPVTAGITFTYGGLRIDTEARVIDNEGRPMPGLYATGEITGGFFYDNYPGGSGLMRGAVFGRRAAASAVTDRA
ncbi:MAG: FAD-dependent oxidoreductase [Propionibacteriales bacterium]|nr:FAD-dependent oxidoreductase [Propionibacteriales bacterium]